MKKISKLRRELKKIDKHYNSKFIINPKREKGVDDYNWFRAESYGLGRTKKI